MPLRSKERELRWVITSLFSISLGKAKKSSDVRIKHCGLRAEEGPWMQSAVLPLYFPFPTTFSNTVPRTQ